MRIRGAALGGFVLVGLVALAGQQEGTVLRHTLGEAKKDSYDFVFSSNQKMQMEGGPGGGQEMPIDMSAKMKMLLDYGAYNAEAAKSDFTMSFTDIKWDMGEMGNMMGGQEPPKELKATGKIDKRNRVTDLKSPDMGMRGMMMGAGAGSPNPFSGMFIEFPEGAVKMGDSWNIETANPLTKDKKSVMTATLAGEKEVDGIAAHIVALKGTMDINGDLSEMLKGTPQGDMMGDMKVLMVGKIDITGEAIVEKATGKTLSMSMNMKSAQNIEMPDMGMKINGAGVTTMKMTLAKKA